jgi:hypothetical protein
MHKLHSVSSAALLAAVLATAAQGSVITVDAISSGWLTPITSNNYFASGTENAFAGYCAADGCGMEGEHRNFFTFEIPDLDGPISSAVLTLNTGGTSFAQNPTATYQVTSLPDTFGFDDLGTGTVFGTLDYSVDSTDADESIVLNNSALAAIAPDSTFGVGGRVTTLAANAAQDEYLFGADSIGDGTAELTITTADTPEPAALGLCSLGLTALLFTRVRRRA